MKLLDEYKVIPFILNRVKNFIGFSTLWFHFIRHINVIS